MKSRPILFSAPMIRALLAGTKTVTRRIVKPQNILNGGDPGDIGVLDRLEREYGKPIRTDHYGVSFDADGVRAVVSVPMTCPYGAPGDRLWVREAWRTAASLNRFSPTEIEAYCEEAGYAKPWAPVQYLADRHIDNGDTLASFGGEWGKTRVSIHMPRWASRITLEVVSVHVERLHALDEPDAQREGVRPFLEVYDHFAADQRIDGDRVDEKPYRTSFVCLWDEINGDRALFSTNPWVWRVEFKRIEATP